MQNTTAPATENKIDCAQKIKSKKPLFILSRKNQKGQVAIFVALIFQIIFIFFALLINVGLLVHHKINLQQSTDLAAYYGAMKQAEMLNVISHVNFQIRQAWKLLTWRYRVLGTFGMRELDSLVLPIQNLSSTTYTGSDAKCGNSGINLNDVPAFCVAHTGFEDWKGPNTDTETSCNIGCNALTEGIGQQISRIRGVGSFSTSGASVGSAVNSAITASNTNLGDKCKRGTQFGARLLAKFVNAYRVDTNNRSQMIKLLLANLSGSKDMFLDLNGQKVFDGAQKTFQNNLTEANAASIKNTFNVLNGLSDDFGAGKDCKYDAATGSSRLVSEIIFKYIAFYAMACRATAASASDFRFVNVYNGALDAIIAEQLGVDAAAITDAIAAPLSLGFEKNPWCQSYYGVRASSEPKIPFLPLATIKLNAFAIAKPFGGSIGPMFYNKWDANSNSSVNGGRASQTDKMMPWRDPAGASTNMTTAAEVTLNYSRYVGDQKGSADVAHIGMYHDLLIGTSKKIGTHWSASPKLDMWNNIGTIGNDSLASGSAEAATVRNLEVSVIAPNQFDLTYYSIEPDFYNNYYLNKLDNGSNSNGLRLIDKLSTNTGVSSASVFARDYGFDSATSKFSILDQLRVVQNITRGLPAPAGSPKTTLSAIPISPASLLTGWTFMNLTNEAGYTTFPDKSQNTTMPFGTCNDKDDLNSQYKSISDASASAPKPPTPGNCVTGGRTGYSVKIISSEAINGQQKDIGGQGTSGPIQNPVPSAFLSF